MARVFNEADFVGKEFSLSTDSPAYFSTLAGRYYYMGKANVDQGKIRAVIVNKKTGNRFFNVVSPKYPGKQLYFKYEAANFSDLVKQGVRTTTEKAADDVKFQEKQNETFFDKLKAPAIYLGVGIAVVYLAGTYIKTNVKHAS